MRAASLYYKIIQNYQDEDGHLMSIKKLREHFKASDRIYVIACEQATMQDGWESFIRTTCWNAEPLASEFAYHQPLSQKPFFIFSYHKVEKQRTAVKR